MGVSCLLSIPATNGRTTAQVLEELYLHLDALGAEKSGVWSVECQTCHATPSLGASSTRMLHTLRSSEYPASCFALLDSGVCLTGDRQLEPLLQQLQVFYASRKNSSMEARGQRYQLGDFLIRPGIASAGPNALGTILEVEYLPCCLVQQCWPMLGQMVARIVDTSQVGIPSMPVAQQEGSYVAADTIAQYLRIFNDLRKIPR